MEHLHSALLRAAVLWTALATLAGPDRRDERGDVPGWVFITVMSVGLVAAIGGIARDQLGAILTAALNQVR